MQPTTKELMAETQPSGSSFQELLNEFRLVLPDQSVCTIRASTLTVEQALAQFPGHILALSAVRPLRLPPSTIMLKWNTYYVHKDVGGRTATVDNHHNRKSLRALHRRVSLEGHLQGFDAAAVRAAAQRRHRHSLDLQHSKESFTLAAVRALECSLTNGADEPQSMCNMSDQALLQPCMKFSGLTGVRPHDNSRTLRPGPWPSEPQGDKSTEVQQQGLHCQPRGGGHAFQQSASENGRTAARAIANARERVEKWLAGSCSSAAVYIGESQASPLSTGMNTPPGSTNTARHVQRALPKHFGRNHSPSMLKSQSVGLGSCFSEDQ